MSDLELTGADRCDQCQAQAYVRVWIPSGLSDLLMCGHHFGQHEARLRVLDAMWVDNRDRINAQLDVSP
jgi:Zn ribbon nucleic-acid-binding protein